MEGVCKTLQLSIGEVDDFFIGRFAQYNSCEIAVQMYVQHKEFSRLEIALEHDMLNIATRSGKQQYGGLLKSEVHDRPICISIPRWHISYLHYIIVEPSYPIRVTLEPSDVFISSDEDGHVVFDDPVPIGAMIYNGLQLTIDVPEGEQPPTVVLGVSVVVDPKIVADFSEHIVVLPNGTLLKVRDKIGFVTDAPLIKPAKSSLQTNALAV